MCGPLLCKRRIPWLILTNPLRYYFKRDIIQREKLQDLVVGLGWLRGFQEDEISGVSLDKMFHGLLQFSWPRKSQFCMQTMAWRNYTARSQRLSKNFSGIEVRSTGWISRRKLRRPTKIVSDIDTRRKKGIRRLWVLSVCWV